MYGSSVAADYIYTIVSPFLIVFGTFGNTVTIIVLLSGKTKSTTTTTIYLVALALADLCVIYAGLLPTWVEYAFDMNFIRLTDVGCKIQTWLKWASLYTSAWILVSLTVTRTVSALCPFSAKERCRPKVAIFILVTISVLTLALNVHSLVFRGEKTVTKNNMTSVLPCQALIPAYPRFLIYYWAWVKLHVYNIVPFAIIFVGNICILSKVFARKRAALNKVVPFNAKDAAEEKKPSGASSLTAMLLTVNAVFLLCTTPAMVFFVTKTFNFPYATRAIEANMILFSAMSEMLMYTNHAVNFLLYFLSGSDFRHQTKVLFCKWRHPGMEDRRLFTRTTKLKGSNTGPGSSQPREGCSLETTKLNASITGPGSSHAPCRVIDG
jgi:hypothetical protein